MANTDLVTEKDIYGDDLFRCYYQTLMESVQVRSNFTEIKIEVANLFHIYVLEVL